MYGKSKHSILSTKFVDDYASVPERLEYLFSYEGWNPELICPDIETIEINKRKVSLKKAFILIIVFACFKDSPVKSGEKNKFEGLFRLDWVTKLDKQKRKKKEGMECFLFYRSIFVLMEYEAFMGMFLCKPDETLFFFQEGVS